MKSFCRFLFLSTPLSAGWQEFGLLVLRLVFGLSLALAHGWGKLPPPRPFIGMVENLGFPAPTVFAWLAGIAEFGGGMLIAIGLATRFGAILIILVMAAALLTAHASDPYGQMELAVLFLAAGVTLFFTGPGRISMDRVIRGR